MTNKELFCLSIFAHKKPVIFGEYVGFSFFSRHRVQDVEAKKIIKMFLKNGWLKREHKSMWFDRDYYTLTDRGDDCYRDEQIRRGGEYRYYHYVERTPESHAKWDEGKRVHEIDAMMQKLDSSNPKHNKLFDTLRKSRDKMEEFMERFVK
jgi:DNA-binding MarR family transcriptional regulator